MSPRKARFHPAQSRAFLQLWGTEPGRSAAQTSPHRVTCPGREKVAMHGGSPNRMQVGLYAGTAGLTVRGWSSTSSGAARPVTTASRRSPAHAGQAPRRSSTASASSPGHAAWTALCRWCTPLSNSPAGRRTVPSPASTWTRSSSTSPAGTPPLAGWATSRSGRSGTSTSGRSRTPMTSSTAATCCNTSVGRGRPGFHVGSRSAGRVILVEDADFEGSFCDPPNDGFAFWLRPTSAFSSAAAATR